MTHDNSVTIKTFADKETQQLFVTGRSRRLPPDLIKRAIRRLEYIHLAKDLKDLSIPPHPGEMLREDFMVDHGVTVTALAQALRASRQTIHELLREQRAITPLMALPLTCFFGNSPQFWLNAQQTGQRFMGIWVAIPQGAGSDSSLG